MKPLKPLLMILVSSSIAGCGKLEPTVCISSPKANMLNCFDYKASLPLGKTYQDVDGWSCRSPADSQNVLNACKRHIKGPTVNQCIVSAETNEFRCYDKAKEQANQIPIEKTENYVCMSPADDKQMLDYCKTSIVQHSGKQQ